MAGLTFGSVVGGGDLFNVAGAQFDMDPSNMKTITYLISSTAVHTVYTVPNGKTLYLTKIMFIVNTACSEWWTKVGDRLIYTFPSSGAETVELDFGNPIKIESGTAITMYNNVTDGETALIGWEQ